MLLSKSNINELSVSLKNSQKEARGRLRLWCLSPKRCLTTEAGYKSLEDYTSNTSQSNIQSRKMSPKPSRQHMQGGLMNLVDAFYYYYDHPVEYVQDTLRIDPQPEQAAMLNGLVSGNVSAKSGHGIGKTAAAAWANLWFMTTRPMCKVPCTAPTQHQLEDVLWPEIRVWLDRSTLRDFFVWTQTRLYVKDYQSAWFSVPRSCSKPENLQGFHARDVLFIVDEASGMPQEIMEVIEGALTNQNARLMMLGNPTQITGMFYDSFHKHRSFYTTFTISSEKSKLVSPDYPKRMALKWGKESDIYKIRVLGQFPKGSPEALIRLDLVESAVKRQQEPEGQIEIGVDPARYGDDSSVIAIRQGLVLSPLITFSGINTTRLTGMIAQEIRALRKKGYDGAITVKVDDTGIGGGVTDQLQEIDAELNIDVIPINNGASANDPDYYNLGANLWGDFKEALKSITIPDDPELITQLTTRKYKIRPDGRIQLEEKDAMKKRGLNSPDKADAAVLAYAQVGGGYIGWV